LNPVWFGLALLGLLCFEAGAQALPVSHGDQRVADDSGEAWAMRHVGAATLMTGMGPLPTLAPGAWALGADLAQVPHLDPDQQRVGLGGSKQEDLNKSPVFGRARLWLGLPAGLVAEIGYTPPLQIDGTRAEDLVAVSVGRRWLIGARYGLSLRAHGQHGAARGDITCPAQVVAGTAEDNPFRCSRRSDDRIALNHYGLEATADAAWGRWTPHLSLGWLHYEPRVAVNAELTEYIERIRLLNSASLRYLAFGVGTDLRRGWRLGAELLYVPLDVRRAPRFERRNDDFLGLRLALRWAPGPPR
jgi:hypothetical protein